MILKRTVATVLALMAFTLSGEAAKRSMHLFGETFVFNFARDFAFMRRVDQADGNRQTVTFTDDNRSIIVSASRYDAIKTEPLISRDDFKAKAAAKKGTDVSYNNDETDAGRAGSHMMGFCMSGSCLYQMTRAIDRKYWLNVLVLCEDCKPPQTGETRKLAETLYQQLKNF